jgi:hypothetical protein
MPDENHIAALWPPSESEWRELLRQLPLDADQTAVRLAIEGAVREYVEDQPRDQALRELWSRIVRVSGSQKVRELFSLILQLQRFPLDPEAEASFCMQRLSRQFVREQKSALRIIYRSPGVVD